MANSDVSDCSWVGKKLQKLKVEVLMLLERRVLTGSIHPSIHPVIILFPSQDVHLLHNYRHLQGYSYYSEGSYSNSVCEGSNA